jgi:ketosteroid isomerase-like protein
VASANVELVQAIFRPWRQGDFRSVDWAHPEIEYVVADGPSPGRWSGLAGMARGFSEDVLSAWDRFQLEPEEFRELDEERVLVLFQRVGRGKSSGLEMRSAGALVFDMQGGTVKRLTIYWDRERALADLGLSSSQT